MARFIGFDPRSDAQNELGFENFVEIAKGGTIRSCAAGDNFVEIGLTDQINVRFEAASDGTMFVVLVSTLNEGDIPPIRLRIIEDGELASAALVEARIRALRQSYAIAFLVQTDRTDELEQAIERDPDADFETLLLSDDERLYITSAAPGSFWLTIITKSEQAYKVAKTALAIPYQEGREALLRRVRAETELKELDVDDKRLEIGLKRVKGAIDVLNTIEEIKDEEARAAMRKSFVGSLDGLGVADTLALPPPRKPSDS